MNIYTKEEAKIRYALRPIPPKAHKNNAGCAVAKPLGIPKTAAQRLHTAPMERIVKTVKSSNFPI